VPGLPFVPAAHRDSPCGTLEAAAFRSQKLAHARPTFRLPTVRAALSKKLVRFSTFDGGFVTALLDITKSLWYTTPT